MQCETLPSNRTQSSKLRHMVPIDGEHDSHLMRLRAAVAFGTTAMRMADVALRNQIAQSALCS
jgi:hypothetical protein